MYDYKHNKKVILRNLMKIQIQNNSSEIHRKKKCVVQYVICYYFFLLHAIYLFLTTYHKNVT